MTRSPLGASIRLGGQTAFLLHGADLLVGTAVGEGK